MNSKSKKNILKHIIPFIIINLLFLYISYTKYSKDIYARDVKLSEMYIDEQATNYVTLTQTDGRDSLCVTPNTDYYGQVIIGPYISVPAGEYDLLLEYSSSTDDVLCEIYSGTVVNSDNSTGQLIASSTLPSGTNTFSLHYVADQALSSVEFKFYYYGGDFTLYSITNQSQHKFTDSFIILGIIICYELITVLLCFYCKRKKSDDFSLVWNFIFLTALALISTIPILNDFQINTMDHMIHCERIDNIADWMRNFSFRQPVMRLAGTAHSNYGYITPVMYPQLFLYFSAFLRIIGCSMLYSYKIIIFLANCATAYIAYFSFSRMSANHQIGLLASALYTMNLYRLMDFYSRGAIGESIAMIFFPLVLYGMYEIFYGDSKRWPYAFLGYTGVIQSHILSTLMITLFCIIFAICSIRALYHAKERIISLLKAALSTLLANLWFIVPFLQYHQLNLIINNSGSDLDLSGVYLSQMFASFVTNSGYNQFTGSTANEMPLTLGTIILIGMLLFIYYLYKSKGEETEIYKIGKGCLIMGLLSLFISSTFFPWEPILSTSWGSHFHAIQYTWRFLAVAAACLSLTSAIGFYQVICHCKADNTRTDYAVIALIGIIVFSSFYFIDSNIPLESSSKSIAEVTREMDQLYLPQSAYGTKNSLSKIISFSEDCDVEVSDFTRGYAELFVTLHVNSCTPDSYMDLPLFCYPNYIIKGENNQNIEYTESPFGLIRIPIFETCTSIHAYYYEPVGWRICSLISLLFVLFLAIYYLRAYRKR
ncbi:MAG: hypothetical protein PUF03_08365 [Lachnospiraceae bacterium]|nr:hypothetical protein [Lachnospiraceae bacterium]